MARLVSTIVVILLAPIFFGGCAATAPAPLTASPTADQLIDRLQDLGNNELSTRTNIIRMGADGREPMPSGLLMAQDPGPKSAEAMEELVRRGTAALPALIAHLDDARKTRSTIHGMFGGLTYAGEFDRRSDEVLPPGVDDGHAFGFGSRKIELAGPVDQDEYRLAVGDVCFTLIGRIVNRRYEATRYQPSGIVIVNSPILCPALRRAVATRWKGLTVEQHRDGLLRDVEQPDWSHRANAGIEALARYFPQEVTEAVAKRLVMPLYDNGAVKDFAMTTLYVDPDAVDRANLIKKFLVENGTAARAGLILQLWDDRTYTIGQKEYEPGPAPVVKVSPTEILGQLVGGPVPTERPMANATDYADTSMFVARLESLPYPLIERPVWDAFQLHMMRHAKDWATDDWIAEECIKLLANHGHDDALRAFCHRRLAEVSEDDAKKFRIQPLLDLLDKKSKRVGI
jgi:hypothetical protein